MQVYETCVPGSNPGGVTVPTCSKCKKRRRLSSFTSRPNGKRYYHCKSCQREYTKAHYQANKSYYAAKARKNDNRLLDTLKDFLRQAKDVPCLDCQQRFPHYVMQFDHVRGKKEFGLGDIHRHKPSLERVEAEVAKCEVVCANCHAIRTYTRR